MGSAETAQSGRQFTSEDPAALKRGGHAHKQVTPSGRASRPGSEQSRGPHGAACAMLTSKCFSVKSSGELLLPIVLNPVEDSYVNLLAKVKRFKEEDTRSN